MPCRVRAGQSTASIATQPEEFGRYDALRIAAVAAGSVATAAIDGHCRSQMLAEPLAMNALAGFSVTGLPMGIEIIGKRHSDLDALKIAHAYEAVTEWVQKRPAPIRG